MNTDVFVIGSGQTKFAEHWDKGLPELMEEAMSKALEHSACTPFEIDAVIVANMLGERTSAQAHLGSLAASLLPHHPPALRVESACASGAVALHMACALLESKRAETVLVLGVEKMTDVPTEEISAALMGAADGERDAASGITFPGLFGLIARRYMHEYGLTREDLSLVSSRHHAFAIENPFAQFRSALSPDTVSESPMIADPLRLLDCSPVSDGAAACILSRTHRSPFRIMASALSSDSLSITQRTSTTSFPATTRAMENALAEAELEREELSAIETHDCFSIAALINLEDLGIAEPGTGIRFYREEYRRGPQVNRSGGLKACGHPVAATGVKQVLDVAKELKRSNAQFGLAHNFGGVGASAAVHILTYTP